MINKVDGIPASAGIAIAKVYRLESPNLMIAKKEFINPEIEISRLEAAIEISKEELLDIKKKANQSIGEDKAAIFDAHLLILGDPEFVNSVQNKIKNERVNAEYALHETATMFVSIFEEMDNEYMKERAVDIRDVTKRVIAHLLGVTIASPSEIDEDVIIIADDLTPSETAQLNRRFVKGFATNIGGRTSHSAIMARSMEIPAVVGTKVVTQTIENGTIVIVDGLDGQVIINPSEELIREYEQKKNEFDTQKTEWKKLRDKETITRDKHHVELAANIGSPDDLNRVLENGAEGIGLFRTEFLYLGRTKFPTEEEQFEAYKTVLEKMGGKPVVVRTLDIGGDKELQYLKLPAELNPFLGFRAIRFCLSEQTIFRTQLRALLRASVYGNLKIMFPMIATLDEFREAKTLLIEEKRKLFSEGVSVSDTIEVGIMVEIPSTAILADQFAKEVDFFSIGTNDLIQYTMAADRMNERVSYLYQPYNPAMLRLVKMVIEGAHKEGKWVGMCGEMAGDALAIPILLGLGLDEFSMSATSILKSRSQIKQLSKLEIEKCMEEIFSMTTTNEVISFVKEKLSLS